jgi:esterase
MIHFKKYGQQGEPLVVIHGLFGSSDNWHSIAQSLSEHFTLYCLDLPNHGKSAALENAAYDTMANTINTWMEQEGIKNCFMLGHSMGGKVAMQFASQFSEKVKRLIVADIAPVSYESSHHVIFDGLKAIDLERIQNRKEADTILSRFVETLGVRQFLLKSLIKTEQGFSWQINIDNLFHNYAQIRSIPPFKKAYEGDTLFIKGEHSDYIQAEHKDAILTWFPKAQVKMIPATGHWLHAEKPLPFTSLVKRFCQKNES